MLLPKETDPTPETMLLATLYFEVCSPKADDADKFIKFMNFCTEREPRIAEVPLIKLIRSFEACLGVYLIKQSARNK